MISEHGGAEGVSVRGLHFASVNKTLELHVSGTQQKTVPDNQVEVDSIWKPTQKKLAAYNALLKYAANKAA